MTLNVTKTRSKIYYNSGNVTVSVVGYFLGFVYRLQILHSTSLNKSSTYFHFENIFKNLRDIDNFYLSSVKFFWLTDLASAATVARVFISSKVSA